MVDIEYHGKCLSYEDIFEIEKDKYYPKFIKINPLLLTVINFFITLSVLAILFKIILDFNYN